MLLGTEIYACWPSQAGEVVGMKLKGNQVVKFVGNGSKLTIKQEKRHLYIKAAARKLVNALCARAKFPGELVTKQAVRMKAYSDIVGAIYPVIVKEEALNQKHKLMKAAWPLEKLLAFKRAHNISRGI